MNIPRPKFLVGYYVRDIDYTKKPAEVDPKVWNMMVDNEINEILREEGLEVEDLDESGTDPIT